MIVSPDAGGLCTFGILAAPMLMTLSVGFAADR